MPDRVLFRVGAACAMAGAALGLVFNVLHPRSSDALDSALGELRLIEEEGIWLFDHVILGIAVGIVLLGLVAISRSITGETGEAWGSLARASAIASTALLFAVVAIDGIALKEISEGIVETAPDNSAAVAAGVATVEVVRALFTAAIGAYFGITALLLGIAVVTSDVYPRWLGYGAVLAGAIGFVAALIQAFDGVGTLPTQILFPISSSLFTLWVFYTGWLLWRKTVPPTLGP